MTRTVQDDDFQTWEVYASSGRWGMPEDAYVVFHCASDRSLRARYAVIDGDKSDAERIVVQESDNELLELLRTAEAVD